MIGSRDIRDKSGYDEEASTESAPRKIEQSGLGVKAKNWFTAEGEVLHEWVHGEHHESRRSFKQEYDMAVRSLHWGLAGVIWLRKHEKSDVDRRNLCGILVLSRHDRGSCF